MGPNVIAVSTPLLKRPAIAAVVTPADESTGSPVSVSSGTADPSEAVSHNAHCEELSDDGTISPGAPAIPSNGPRGVFAIAELFTFTGFNGLPTISRADVRFVTGYSFPSSRWT